MGNVTRYPDGTFCWVDLGTTDPAGARRFYGGLFGWEFVDTPSPDGAIYTLCRLDGRDVTAIHEHTPDEGSGWTSYVAVDDVEAATNRAVLLGARLTIEPFDIPGAARMAEVVDPAGAMVALWQEAGHIGAGVVNEFGTWTWTELVAQDLDAAIRFYGDLFGWTASDLPTPARRVSFSKDARLVAGGHVPTAGERPDPPLGRRVPRRRRGRERGAGGGARWAGRLRAHGHPDRALRDRGGPGRRPVDDHPLRSRGPERLEPAVNVR